MRRIDIGSVPDVDDRGAVGNAVQLNRRESQDAANTEQLAIAVRDERYAAKCVAIVNGGDEVLFFIDRRADTADEKRIGPIELHVDLRFVRHAAVGGRTRGAAGAPVRDVEAHGVDEVGYGVGYVRIERHGIAGARRRIPVTRGIVDIPVGEAFSPFITR